MDWKTFKTVLGALVLFSLVQTHQLVTIGGMITAFIVVAALNYERKPKLPPPPPRLYPEGQEPDAAEWK